MSIWTFSRALAVLCGLSVLTGCDDLPDLSVPTLGATKSAPQTVAVANGSVVIGGPRGYCVDRTASKLGGDSAFVVLASCASITQDPEQLTRNALGLLTASVAKRQAGGPGLLSDRAVLEQFLASEAGRAALARDGRPGSVTIQDLQFLDEAVMIRLRDTSQAELADVDEVYWRGLTDVSGHLVTISVVSFAARPIPVDTGLAKLRAFLARIRAETAAQVAVN